MLKILKIISYILKVKLDKFKYEECSRKNPKGRKSYDGVRNDTQICYGSYTDEKDTCKVIFSKFIN